MSVNEIITTDLNEYDNKNNASEFTTNETTETKQYSYPTLFSNKTLLELCCHSLSPSVVARDEVQPYLRGCKWSPDGTCCLSVINNDGVHVMELPRDLYSGSVTTNRTIDVLDSIIHIKESGLIYDFCWYPNMNSSIPETCCWLTTRQNGPIQMWDAFDGTLRCSYRGFNAVDEMEPAISVTFNIDGSRIIAGYKKYLRTFDVERPGRDFAEHKTNSPASCIATSSNLLAVGSWNTTISLFNVNEMGCYKSIGKMHGHSGGLTHMKFTPDGLKLISGARKDHRLLVWDIRYYRRPLNVLSRVVDTNQRVYFDISPCGKYLVSGGTDGLLRVWDVNKIDWHSSLDVTNMDKDNVSYTFPLHKDCCNSVSIHPCRPILATGSGQYHFKDMALFVGDENEMLMDTVEDNCDHLKMYTNDITMNSANMKYSSEQENSLVFWWTGEMFESK